MPGTRALLGEMAPKSRAGIRGGGRGAQTAAAALAAMEEPPPKSRADLARDRAQERKRGLARRGSEAQMPPPAVPTHRKAGKDSTAKARKQEKPPDPMEQDDGEDAADDEAACPEEGEEEEPVQAEQEVEELHETYDRFQIVSIELNYLILKINLPMGCSSSV